MVQIVLIRPGSTEFDLQGRIQGTLDIPLCEQGRAEVRELIGKLKARSLTALYCAPGDAATETAHILGDALGIKVKPLEALRNLNQGLWQGMRVDEVKLKQPKVYRQWQEQPENVCPPDGEMVSEAQVRITEAVERLVKKHRTGSVGVVASEPLATLFAHRIAGGELGDLWKAQNGCDRCQDLVVDATMWREVSSVAGGKSPESNGR
jgi:broad specificity phosphatase PhoE